VKHAFYVAPLLVALTRLASAQPAPAQPAPQPAPVPDTPASTTEPTPANGEAVPPTGEAVPPTEAAPPVEQPPVEPAPPPPKPFTGLVPSSAGDQRLAQHELALERETTVPDHPFTASVFADYWFTAGPRVGGTVGMFRAFEAHLGVLLDSQTVMGTMPGTTTTTSSTRIFYGITAGLLSIRGVQLAGGLIVHTGQGDTGEMIPTGQLTVPLDAHWLPFRVEKTRVRITYPIGIGIEWGML